MSIQAVSVPEGKQGAWAVERFTVTENDPGALYYALKSRPLAPGQYTRLTRNGSVVMSDAPAERSDHYGFVHNATGHVLINGLGLGMCLQAALAKLEVEHATVIEVEQDVIDLVAPTYHDDRVTIVHADAFDYAPPKGQRYGAVWHDIWDNICADNLDDMKRLHRKYGRHADWQGSWCRWECERAASASRW